MTAKTKTKPKPSLGPEEMWPIERVKPYPKNARAHPKEQVKQVAALIARFGWTYPILVDEKGIIIAGHGRREAALYMDMKQVPVRVAHGWTEQKKSEYRLADNRVALNSTWDDELLRVELGKLAGGKGLDLTMLGFSELDLQRLEIPGFEKSADGSGTESKLGEVQFSVLLRCTDEAHQGKLLERFEKEGLPCEALMT